MQKAANPPPKKKKIQNTMSMYIIKTAEEQR